MRKSLYANYMDYRKMATGGGVARSGGNGTPWGGIVGGAGFVTNAITDVVDANATPDGNGLQKPNMGGTIAKSTVAGAAAGTAILPGWGTAVGAVVGAAAGVIGGSAQRKKYDRLSSQYDRANMLRGQQMTAARIASDPSLVYGNMNGTYYERGGRLLNPGSNTPTIGGRLKSLSRDSSEVEGPSHTGGGVKMPLHSAELEGEETIDKDYVFSKKLGFAQAHRPLAKSIGIIEQKPLSPERKNALDVLRGQTDLLKTKQELVKSFMNHQNIE